MGRPADPRRHPAWQSAQAGDHAVTRCRRRHLLPLQALNGFLDKSDGRDKLLAAVQVRRRPDLAW